MESARDISTDQIIEAEQLRLLSPINKSAEIPDSSTKSNEQNPGYFLQKIYNVYNG